MITYLRVKNLAIVDEFVIEPGTGLNVLTGETGAGKSLLIDSLEFISGARGSTDLVRSGEEKMYAEAVLQIPAGMRSDLEELGFELADDGPTPELIIKREMSATGRGRVLAGGSPVSVRELTAATAGLIEIHGQDDSRERIAGRKFLEIVDAFAGNEEPLSRTRSAYRAWRKAHEELERLRAADANRALQLDLLKYQIEEIATARLEPGEEERLREERAILHHAQELIASTAGAFALIEEDDASAREQIGRALHLLQPLARNIGEVGRLSSELSEAAERLSDVARSLSRIVDSVRPDPERLEEIEARLAAIERLKKKYGGSVEAVLEHFETIEPEFQRLTDFDQSIEKLEGMENHAFETYRKAAREISKRRTDAARKLEQVIERELKELAMAQTTVRIRVHQNNSNDSRLTIDGQPVAFGADGYDAIEFLIAPNAGESPKPLQKIASGGELSRIQLAIAAAMFREETAPTGATLVFDEIDAGVGGRVAEAVGQKLLQLAQSYQVICVTHLPQIASLGTTHFRVWKEEAKGRTRARIARLDDRNDRVDEIARMLAGAEITESARAHARALLDGSATTAAPPRPARSAR